jgi:hypothetical protein
MRYREPASKNAPLTLRVDPVPGGQAMRLRATARPGERRLDAAARELPGVVRIDATQGWVHDRLAELSAGQNKALTPHSGQQHGPKYIPTLIEHTVRGDLDPSMLATHRVSLDEGARAYEMFEQRADGCLRAVLYPGRSAAPQPASAS